MATYGLTPNGFVVKQQQTIISEIQAELQQTFGANINLGSQSVFGQIVGIFSEREALLWQLLDAIYSSQYPNGAQGTSVDNILALNNLKRLKATASIVDLVLTGTPGTLIEKGSLAQTGGSPVLQFSTNADATIASALNAIQTLFFSSVPNQGLFTLSIVDPDQNTETTGNIYWMSPGASGTTIIQSLTQPTSGQYKITVNGLSTALLSFDADAATIQTAIRLLSGYTSVSVSGVDFSSGFTITWTGVSTAIARIASVTSSTLNAVTFVGNAVQDLIQILTPDSGMTFPYAGVTVSGGFSTGFVITFAGGAGSQAQNLFTTPANTLFNGSVAVNILVANTQIGSPAQVLVTASCTVTGPNFAPANSVNQIGSPVTGWSGVNNPLDAIPGSNVETDTEALQRRTTLLAAQANGPIQSIVEKVSQINGVSQAIGIQNLSNASLQNIKWVSIPSSGTWKIQMGGISGQVTSVLAFNASASAIQNAINILFGFGDVIVTGSYSIGFTIAFGPTSGNGAQPLAIITANTTGVTTSVANGRPGKSFEIIADYPGLPVINTALEQAIGQIIYLTKPAGMTAFGDPVLTTNGTTTADSDQLTVASVVGIAVGMTIIGTGIPVNTTILVLSGSTITMSNEATLSGTVAVDFKTVIQIVDESGNFFYIPFSKPELVPVFIAISLTVLRSTFPANGVQQIQQDMVTIGDELKIGQQVTLFGTNGLVGAFNSVPGIINYTLAADVVPSPTNTANIPMGDEQLAQIESFNIICTVNFQ